MTVGTRHGAKGLEFKAVAIVGCHLGLAERYNQARRLHNMRRCFGRQPVLVYLQIDRAGHK